MREGARIGPDGKYLLERKLGIGGMGVVFQATDTVLSRPVAVKFLRSDGPHNDAANERLLTEARAVAAVGSDHVVRILDTGRDAQGRLFVVMEKLDGEDLAARLRRHGPFESREAVWCILQAAEALAHAHVAGFVHRDIKPSNLFAAHRTDGREIIKVLDFGVAKVLDSEGPTVTGLDVLGTLHFMSPEQLQDAKDVDARADVWSLGVTLFQLLSGAMPWEGKTGIEIGRAIMQTDARSLTSLGIEIPAGLDKAVLGCLVRDRDKRHANMFDVASALAPFGPDGAAQFVEIIDHLLSGAVTRVGPPDAGLFGFDSATQEATAVMTRPETLPPTVQAEEPLPRWDSVTVRTESEVETEARPALHHAPLDDLDLDLTDKMALAGESAPSTEAAAAHAATERAPSPPDMVPPTLASEVRRPLPGTSTLPLANSPVPPKAPTQDLAATLSSGPTPQVSAPASPAMPPAARSPMPSALGQPDSTSTMIVRARPGAEARRPGPIWWLVAALILGGIAAVAGIRTVIGR